MKCLEIIELCCACSEHATVETRLTELLGQVSGVSLKVYTHGLVDTDFSVHLAYERTGCEVSLSVTGEQIAAALRAFGMVNHSVWIQRGVK